MNKDETDNYAKNVLPTLLARYNPEDIYNVDETGLFYKLLPDKAYTMKNEACHGGKNSKERITLLLGANMTGTDKLRPIVMGKAVKPRCFHRINVNALPVTYTANRTAWMTSEIFNQWLSKWNRRLQAANRNVLLFIDNCAAHNLIGGYSNISIHYLPPNATSVLQPMDQGIINSFKIHYRSRLVRRILAAIERRNGNMKINILDAINLLYTAWREVTPTTIANCFRKAGFVKEAEGAAEEVVEEPSEVDRNVWDAIQEQYEIDIPFENYVAVDDAVLTGENMTDEEIVQSVIASKDTIEVKKEEPEEEDEEEEVSDRVPENTAQCLESIAGIQAFFQTSSVPEYVLEALKTLEDHAVQSSIARRKKQCKLTDIFKKE